MTNVEPALAPPLIVVAAALRDPAGRVLVQRRPAGKAHGGLWEFPGGKVEPGERIEHALARELREELAILVDVAAATPVGFARGDGNGRELLLLLYAIGRWRGDPRPLAAEALAWHAPADLAALPMPPADRPLVAALCQRS